MDFMCDLEPFSEIWSHFMLHTESKIECVNYARFSESGYIIIFTQKLECE